MHLKAIGLAFLALGSLVAYASVHDPWFELVAILACIAVVMGMPDPRPDSSVAYKWLYRSTHIFFNLASHFLMPESAWKALEPKAGILQRLKEDPADAEMEAQIARRTGDAR